MRDLPNKQYDFFPLNQDCSSEQFCALSLTLHQFAESLGTAIDIKDDLTSNHSFEVAEISLLIAQSMRLDPAYCDAIHIAGHLHDIGKIGISDQVLKKAGPLTTAEWQEMRQHSAHGYAILKPVKSLTHGYKIAEMVLSHHERFEGNGYPQGLQGNDIPLGARIIAVADALSTMLGNRRYRQAEPWESAVQEISTCSGSHFDPEVTHAFFRVESQARQKIQTVSGGNRTPPASLPESPPPPASFCSSPAATFPTS